MVSFTVTAKEKQLVFSANWCSKVECVNLVLETLPLCGSVCWIEGGISVVDLGLQTEVGGGLDDISYMFYIELHALKPAHIVKTSWGCSSLILQEETGHG